MDTLLWLACIASTLTLLLFSGQIQQKSLRNIAKASNWVVVSLAILSPFFYEYPALRPTIYTFDGDRAIAQPFGTFCSKWVMDCPKVNPDLEITAIVPMDIAGLQISLLRLSIKVGLIDPSLFFHESGRRNTSVNNCQNELFRLNRWNDNSTRFHTDCPGVVMANILIPRLRSLLLSNQESGVLGQFNDELDWSQQTAIEDLIASHLDPLIGKDGLKVETVRFSLETREHY